MCGKRQALSLLRFERGIRRNDGNRGVRCFADSAFKARCEGVGRNCLGPAQPTKFTIALVWCGPEMRAIANQGRANSIDRDERCDGVAGFRLGRCAAQAAFHARNGCAIACADRAEVQFLSGAVGRFHPEPEIGRGSAPFLIAAIHQIEQDDLWDDRHRHWANLEAAAFLAQHGLYAASRIKPKGRAA